MSANRLHRDVLAFEIKNGAYSTSIQKIDREDRRTNLYRKVQKFRDRQSTVMPLLRPHLRIDDAVFRGQRNQAETIPLHMHSSIPLPVRTTICSQELIDAEAQLRQAEAFDALDTLRNHLRNRTFAQGFKTRNSVGVRATTKAQEVLNHIEARIYFAKTRYRHARHAHLSLFGEERWIAEGWDKKLKELREEDVRGISEKAMNDEERVQMERAMDKAKVRPTIETTRILKSKPDGKHTISWIWLSVNIDDDHTDPGLHSGKFFSEFFSFDI